MSQIDVFFQYEADHEDTSVRLCTVAVPIDGPWICDSKKVARDGSAGEGRFGTCSTYHDVSLEPSD
jgi:hypothetical protein